MQNHELVSETVVQADNGSLTAVYEARLKGGGAVSSRQPLQDRDANLLAVAKKFGVADIARQLAAKGITWADVQEPQPKAKEPKILERAPEPEPDPQKADIGTVGAQRKPFGR